MKREESTGVRPPRSIDRFIPAADHEALHEVTVRAPADLVFDVACDFDMLAHPLIRGIFWLRGRMLRAPPTPRRQKIGLVSEMTSLGWGTLELRPGRELVMGAVTRPWEANVVFRAVPRASFARFAEPGLVKIAWTIEADPVAPALTRLRSETRALATDEWAKRRFHRYWRTFGFGIVMIRILLLPRIRREAERRHRAASRRR